MSDRDVGLVDRDLAEDGDDDVTVADGALIAQDIHEHLYTPVGSLPYRPGHGSNLLRWLNSPFNRNAEVLAELRRVALADGRVDATTIEAYVETDGSFELGFVPLGKSLRQVIAVPAPGATSV